MFLFFNVLVSGSRFPSSGDTVTDMIHLCIHRFVKLLQQTKHIPLFCFPVFLNLADCQYDSFLRLCRCRAFEYENVPSCEFVWSKYTCHGSVNCPDSKICAYKFLSSWPWYRYRMILSCLNFLVRTLCSH